MRLSIEKHKRLIGIGLFALAVGMAPPAANAQSTTEPDGASDDIIVTAQKVAEPLSKIPVTISALSAEALEDRNYTSLADFTGAVPGLQVNNYVGQARTNIRGIGQNSLSLGADSQVPYSLDGVYVGQAFSAAQAFLDLERVEVLRGPQGTLYGRNATGGVINLITPKPKDKLEAKAELTVGNYNLIHGEAVISGPLAVGIKARLAVAAEDRKGYSYNLFDRHRYDDSTWQAARGTLVFDLSDALSLTVIGDYYHANDGSYATHLFGKSPGKDVITGVFLGGHTVPLDAAGQAINPRLLNIDTKPEHREESGGVLGVLAWNFTDQLSFKSLSGWRKADLYFTLDFDSTEIPFEGLDAGKNMSVYQTSEQFSQEFQFIGNLDRLRWVSGLYYFHQNIDPGFFRIGLNFGVPTAPFIVPLELGGTAKTDAYAAFGQATYEVTDRLSATLGLRYSHEKRRATLRQLVPLFGGAADAFDADKTSFSDLSPKFTLDYQATDQFLIYGTVSKGFQSGGFDISAQPPLAAYAPERVWNYEIGAKFRNRLLSLDLAAFYYDYTDLQVAQIVNGLPVTANAASSVIKGAEASITVRPVRNLTLTGSFSMIDSKFKDFINVDPLSGAPVDLEGNRLPGAAKYSANISADYTIPLANGNSIALFGEWNWRDRIYFSEFNSKQVSQPGVSTINASISFNTGGGLSFEAFGKNLSNERIAVAKYITGAGYGSMVLGQLAAPRTYGIRARYQF